jgi:hypothetical protein
MNNEVRHIGSKIIIDIANAEDSLSERKPQGCKANAKNSHDGEWGKIGFCPCGEYIAHQSDRPCKVADTITNEEFLPKPDNCTCRTEACPCGSFVSHKAIDPCTAKE